MPDLETARRWWADGQRAVDDAVQRLTDDDLQQPSALRGWTRAHVVAHLARNADALVNLCTWARTGVETPMYPSREARDSAIEATSSVRAEALRDDYARTEARLAETVAVLPVDAWDASIRNGQGRTVAAREIPWMRVKELWVHGIDLDAGLDWPDVPAEVCTALVDDVLALFASRDQLPHATITATDIGRTWGSGAARVEGPVHAVAAWLTRSDQRGLTGDVPELPAWL